MDFFTGVLQVQSHLEGSASMPTPQNFQNCVAFLARGTMGCFWVITNFFHAGIGGVKPVYAGLDAYPPITCENLKKIVNYSF